LLGHDPMMPVARCTQIGSNGIALHGTIKFPSAGVSQVADSTYSPRAGGRTEFRQRRLRAARQADGQG
jgi:hypothetical protein